MRPSEMGAAIARNLQRKTGRTLEEWIDLVRREGPSTRRERVEWLKSVHGLGTVTASQVAGWAEPPTDEVEPTDAELIDAQYAGPKAALRPIYQRVAAAVAALGPDATLEARETYVSLTRKRQFGLIRAATRSRVDLGLRLPVIVPNGRLRAPGSIGPQGITHKVSLSSPEDVDDEVVGWLRAAYQARR